MHEVTLLGFYFPNEIHKLKVAFQSNKELRTVSYDL